MLQWASRYIDHFLQSWVELQGNQVSEVLIDAAKLSFSKVLVYISTHDWVDSLKDIQET